MQNIISKIPEILKCIRLPYLLWCIAGVLFFIYAIIIYRVGSGTTFFMLWFIASFCSFLMPIVLKFGLWLKVPRPLRITFWILFSIGLAIFILVEGLVISGFFSKPGPKADSIIVLGAQIRGDYPSVVLKYRLDRAYDYLCEYPDTIAIVSGGQGSNEPLPEAEVMSSYLVSRGIDPSRILIEDQSTNTIENIKNSFKLVDPKSTRIGIVTSNFHIFRGVAIARRQGAKNICGIPADSHKLYMLNNVVREFFGVVKDKLLGNM